jgi:hypothetical protein
MTGEMAKVRLVQWLVQTDGRAEPAVHTETDQAAWSKGTPHNPTLPAADPAPASGLVAQAGSGADESTKNGMRSSS